jgi:hypothetical protein
MGQQIHIGLQRGGLGDLRETHRIALAGCKQTDRRGEVSGGECAEIPLRTAKPLSFLGADAVRQPLGRSVAPADLLGLVCVDPLDHGIVARRQTVQAFTQAPLCDDGRCVVEPRGQRLQPRHGLRRAALRDSRSPGLTLSSFRLRHRTPPTTWSAAAVTASMGDVSAARCHAPACRRRCRRSRPACGPSPTRRSEARGTRSCP